MYPDAGDANELPVQAVLSHPLDSSVSQAPLVYDPAALQAMPEGNFNFADSYQQDFWDLSILASTNWLDVTNASQAYSQPLHSFPVSCPTATDPGQDQVTEVVGAAVTAQLAPSDRTSSITGNTPARTGEFYVDARRARGPRRKKRKINPTQTTSLRSPTTLFSVEPPPLPSHSTSEASVELGQYEAFSTAYEQLCVNPRMIWTAFEPTPFLSKSSLETLLSIYLDRCAPAMPILHISSLRSPGLHWSLLLAAASLGAHHIENESAQHFFASLHEFQRRAMRSFEEAGWPDQMSDPAQRMSAILLNFVGAAYSGQKASSEGTHNKQHTLYYIFFEASREARARLFTADQVTDDVSWHNWREREWYTRLAYFAWQLDCMMAYHHDTRPLLRLSDVDLPVPCHERLWNAGNIESWLAISREQPQLLASPPTLNRAVQELYVEKALPRERGEYARVLLTHALMHRMWDVEHYLSNPLSQWEPVAMRQATSEVLRDNVWLAGNKTFTRWQNSTCDALDVLHWQANLTLASANGFEHPTVLHLHVARIVCLVPYARIVSLARSLTANNDLHSRPHVDLSTQDDAVTIRRWAGEHQYKARLSVIHAGATLWHLRRFSTDAFYEAPAIALATLTLWAFGVFANKSHPARLANGSPSQAERSRCRLVDTRPTLNEDAAEVSDDDDYTEDENRTSDIILLDRPTDDELVQQFIRHGDSMEAWLSGVGNLYADKGPELVLQEGCKLLELDEKVWGVAVDWKALLSNLNSRCQLQNGGLHESLGS